MDLFRGDLHQHLLMKESLFFFRGDPGEAAPRARRPGTIAQNQVTLAGLRTARVGVVVSACYSHTFLRARGHLANVLRQAEALKAFARAHEADCELALDPGHARRIAATGRVALILSVEGGQGVRGPEEVDALFAAGVRMLTLVHLIDTELGGAATGPLGEQVNWLASTERTAQGVKVNRRGLTERGAAVVKRMRALGMLLDLSHASDRTAREASAIVAQAGAPWVYSHTGARTLHRSERNVSDEAAQAAVAAGGTVGLTLWRSLLAVDIRRPGGIPGTMTDLAAHYGHLLKTCGPMGLALGTDLNGMVRRPRAAGTAAHGIRHTGDLASLERFLADAGHPVEALDLTGPNLLRPFDKAWEAADAAAQRQAQRAARPARALAMSAPNLPRAVECACC